MPNRVVLITGGAKGIGRAVALELGKLGWSVAVCYRSSQKEAQELVGLIEQGSSQALAVKADVGDPEACKSLVDQVRSQLGGIDALIHCAGPYHRVDYFSETIKGWTDIFRGNLESLFILSQLVSPEMKEKGWGRIVTFAMTNANRDIPPEGITAHFIAKHGVMQLTRTLAKLLGPSGITSNTISPGVIDSGSLPKASLDPLIKQIPAGRLGKPKDIVPLVTFLLSDQAQYINGANISVSGGWGL